MIIRNTQPRLLGVASSTIAEDGKTVCVWSKLFQPGNNVVTVEEGKKLASIPAFKSLLEQSKLVVVSKGDTAPPALKEGLKGIYSVAVLTTLSKDPQYAALVGDIEARIKDLSAPPKGGDI